MGKKNFVCYFAAHTLVEIIIVVAIIALLCAIVVPGLLKIKINANEQAAVSAGKSICIAAKRFALGHNGRFPETLAVLWSLKYPASVTTEGYYFNYMPLENPAAGFWISIQPLSSNTGINFYYIDEHGVVCKGQKAALGHAFLDSVCPADFSPLQ